MFDLEQCTARPERFRPDSWNDSSLSDDSMVTLTNGTLYRRIRLRKQHEAENREWKFEPYGFAGLSFSNGFAFQI
jgi:hypothetical protein